MLRFPKVGEVGGGLAEAVISLGIELDDARRAAAEALGSLALPSSSDEIWRYTDVSFLGDIEFGFSPAIVDPASYCSVSEVTDTVRELKAVVEESPGGGAISWVAEDLGDLDLALVVRQGVPAAALLSSRAAELGVSVRWSAPSQRCEATKAWRLCDPLQDVFTATTAALGARISVDVPSGARLERPMLIVVDAGDSSADSQLVPEHCAIDLGEGSAASIVVFHTGGDGGEATLLSLPVTEVWAGQDSVLTYVTLQDYAPGVVHLETTKIDLARTSKVTSAVVSLGGRLSRHRFECSMSGEGAESEMLGIYFGSQDQHIDFRTLQDHRAPRTVSDLLYKGAVEDRASAVYAGLVRVEKDAQKINGFQTNKNLVLSEDASAESIPTLEILANDVKCSHASSIGPVDEEEVYYLGTRGIDPETAEQLVVEGFFEEVIERIPDGLLAARIRKEVREKFESRETAQALEPRGGDGE